MKRQAVLLFHAQKRLEERPAVSGLALPKCLKVSVMLSLAAK